MCARANSLSLLVEVCEAGVLFRKLGGRPGAWEFAAAAAFAEAYPKTPAMAWRQVRCSPAAGCNPSNLARGTAPPSPPAGGVHVPPISGTCSCRAARARRHTCGRPGWG